MNEQTLKTKEGNQNLRRIVNKLTSGRWIMTVIASLTFAAVTLMGKLPAEEAKEIFMLIAAFYFGQRSVEKQQGAE